MKARMWRFILAAAVGLVAEANLARQPAAVAELPGPATQPAQVDAFDQAVRAIQNARTPSDAIQAYARAQELQVNALAAERAYLRRMVSFGLPEMADAQARDLLTRDASNGLAWATVAYMDARSGKTSGALSTIAKAAKLAPDDPFVQRTAAQLLAWYDSATDRLLLKNEVRESLEQMRQDLRGKRVFADAYRRALNIYVAETAAEQPESGAQAQQPTTEPSSAAPEVPRGGYMPPYTAQEETAVPEPEYTAEAAPQPQYTSTYDPGEIYAPSTPDYITYNNYYGGYDNEPWWPYSYWGGGLWWPFYASPGVIAGNGFYNGYNSGFYNGLDTFLAFSLLNHHHGFGFDHHRFGFDHRGFGFAGHGRDFGQFGRGGGQFGFSGGRAGVRSPAFGGAGRGPMFTTGTRNLTPNSMVRGNMGATNLGRIPRVNNGSTAGLTGRSGIANPMFNSMTRAAPRTFGSLIPRSAGQRSFTAPRSPTQSFTARQPLYASRSFSTGRSYSIPRSYSAPRSFSTGRSFSAPRSFSAGRSFAAPRSMARFSGGRMGGGFARSGGMHGGRR